MALIMSPEQQEIIKKMRAGHRTITEMCQRTGIPYYDIQSFLRKWNFRQDYWSEEEDCILWREIKAGKKYGEVAAMLPGRSTDAVRHRVSYFEIKKIREYKKSDGELSFSIPQNLMAERDRRRNEPRTLTMELCGDPPFSQSGLARAAREIR